MIKVIKVAGYLVLIAITVILTCATVNLAFDLGHHVYASALRHTLTLISYVRSLT